MKACKDPDVAASSPNVGPCLVHMNKRSTPNVFENLFTGLFEKCSSFPLESGKHRVMEAQAIQSVHSSCHFPLMNAQFNAVIEQQSYQVRAVLAAELAPRPESLGASKVGLA